VLGVRSERLGLFGEGLLSSTECPRDRVLVLNIYTLYNSCTAPSPDGGVHRAAASKSESVDACSTTGVDSAVDRRSDKTRQEHLPMLRCPGLPGFR
jgi:hypothetical protein